MPCLTLLPGVEVAICFVRCFSICCSSASSATRLLFLLLFHLLLTHWLHPLPLAHCDRCHLILVLPLQSALFLHFAGYLLPCCSHRSTCCCSLHISCYLPPLGSRHSPMKRQDTVGKTAFDSPNGSAITKFEDLQPALAFLPLLFRLRSLLLMFSSATRFATRSALRFAARVAARLTLRCAARCSLASLLAPLLALLLLA